MKSSNFSATYTRVAPHKYAAKKAAANLAAWSVKPRAAAGLGAAAASASEQQQLLQQLSAVEQQQQQQQPPLQGLQQQQQQPHFADQSEEWSDFFSSGAEGRDRAALRESATAAPFDQYDDIALDTSSSHSSSSAAAAALIGGPFADAFNQVRRCRLTSGLTLG